MSQYNQDEDDDKQLPELNYNPSQSAENLIQNSTSQQQPEAIDPTAGMHPDVANYLMQKSQPAPSDPTAGASAGMSSDDLNSFLGNPPAAQRSGPSRGQQIINFLSGTKFGQVHGGDPAAQAHSAIGDLLQNGVLQGAKPGNDDAGQKAADAEGGDTGEDVAGDINPILKSYLQKKLASTQPAPAERDPEDLSTAKPTEDYGFTSDRDDDALKQAMANQAANDRVNNLFKGGAMFATAASGHGPDLAFNDAITKQNAQPVANILQLRKAAGESLDFSDKQRLNDPNSQENQAFRSALQQAMPGLKNAPGANAITLANPGPFVQVADTFQKAAATKQAHQDSMDMKRLMFDNSQHQKEITGSVKAQNDLDHDLAQQKIPEKLNSLNDADKSLDLALTNPIAFGSKAAEMVRAVTGSSRISGDLMKAFGGDQSLMGRFDQEAQKLAHGTITKDNYGYYKQLIQTLKKSAEQRRDEVVNKHSARHAANYGMSLDQAKQQIAPSSSDAASPAAAGAPPVGHEEGGYRFKGGDPGDQQNWEKM